MTAEEFVKRPYHFLVFLAFVVVVLLWVAGHGAAGAALYALIGVMTIVARARPDWPGRDKISHDYLPLVLIAWPLFAVRDAHWALMTGNDKAETATAAPKAVAAAKPDRVVATSPSPAAAAAVAVAAAKPAPAPVAAAPRPAPAPAPTPAPSPVAAAP
ncbi:hypothetical protein, partial [Rhodovastum atsumiense]